MNKEYDPYDTREFIEEIMMFYEEGLMADVAKLVDDLKRIIDREWTYIRDHDLDRLIAVEISLLGCGYPKQGEYLNFVRTTIRAKRDN